MSQPHPPQAWQLLLPIVFHLPSLRSWSACAELLLIIVALGPAFLHFGYSASFPGPVALRLSEPSEKWVGEWSSKKAIPGV